jgi:hypothetical protein
MKRQDSAWVAQTLHLPQTFALSPCKYCWQDPAKYQDCVSQYVNIVDRILPSTKTACPNLHDVHTEFNGRQSLSVCERDVWPTDTWSSSIRSEKEHCSFEILKIKIDWELLSCNFTEGGVLYELTIFICSKNSFPRFAVSTPFRHWTAVHTLFL